MAYYFHTNSYFCFQDSHCFPTPWITYGQDPLCHFRGFITDWARSCFFQRLCSICITFTSLLLPPAESDIELCLGRVWRAIGTGASTLTAAASRRIPPQHWIWELIHKSETTPQWNSLMRFWSRWFLIWDLGRQWGSVPKGVDLQDCFRTQISPHQLRF